MKLWYEKLFIMNLKHLLSRLREWENNSTKLQPNCELKFSSLHWSFPLSFLFVLVQLSMFKSFLQMTPSQVKNPTFYTIGRWTIVHIAVDIYGLNGIYSTVQKGHKKIETVQWRLLIYQTSCCEPVLLIDRTRKSSCANLCGKAKVMLINN